MPPGGGAPPCLRILRTTRKERGEQQDKIDFLTREELTLLLETCREHFPAHYPFILLLARTGLRIGEAVALQWSALDFHGRFLEVKLNWVDGKLTTPKSSRRRRVDTSLHLTETLQALHLERKKETLSNGWREVPPWVFTSQVRTMLNPDNFRSRVWSKLLAKAGLRHIRIHDLRHTFASLLIQNGESLTYVKEQMGHHSIRVTVDTYGHL
jgi:integrase